MAQLVISLQLPINLMSFSEEHQNGRPYIERSDTGQRPGGSPISLLEALRPPEHSSAPNLTAFQLFGPADGCPHQWLPGEKNSCLVSLSLNSSNRSSCIDNAQLRTIFLLNNRFQIWGYPFLQTGLEIVFFAQRNLILVQKIGYGFEGTPSPPLQTKFSAKRGLRIWGSIPPFSIYGQNPQSSI